MTRVIGPNGAVVGLPDSVAHSLVGDGRRGYSIAAETPAAKTEPRKRAPRKPKTD